MENSDLPREYVFGTYRLILRPNRLLQGNEPIALAQRALMVLAVLVEHAGEIVSRDELFDTVWPDRLVEPGNLGVQLSTLRNLLGRELIQTVPGRGYRIAAVVTVGDAPLVTPPGETASGPSAPERTNLPTCLTSLIGRDEELAELVDRLMRERLMTITGPGGVGKTRLALAVGQRCAADFRDGVWQIDLAPLSDPALIATATATALGVALHNTQMPLEAVVAAIARKRLLLIFDNCEYLAASAGELIQTLLDRVPGVSVLVTSQEILRLPAETAYRLDPLAVPPEPADGKDKADEIAGYGAIELFMARARAADRRFRLDAGNAAPVAGTCRDLEGVPLALEMAAARLPLLGIKGLHERLGERLAMLAARSRAGKPRHQTLLATVEWSYGLLDAADQQIFRHLALFRGGFSLDAAIAVAGANQAEPWATVDALQRLIDKSLGTVDTGGMPRYRLLETLRLYAVQELTKSGEIAVIAERHARHFIGFFDDADMLRESVRDSEWRSVHLPEIDNVRAAFDWALGDPARAPLAIALAAATAVLWSVVGQRDMRNYFGRTEKLIDHNTPDSEAARLLSWGGTAWVDLDRPRGLALVERSMTLYRRLDQPMRLAQALSQIGLSYTFLHRYDEARDALGEAEELLSTGGYQKKLSVVLGHLGFLASHMDDATEARRCFTQALELSRAVNDVFRQGYHLVFLAEFEFKMGAVAAAVDRAREAVGTFRSLHQQFLLGWTLNNLAAYSVAQDNVTEARACAEEASLLLRGQTGRIVRDRLQLWGLLGAIEGKYASAAKLIGYIDAAYAAFGESRDLTEQYIHGRLTKLLEDNLSASAILAYAAEGAKWNEDQAADFADDQIISRAG